MAVRSREGQKFSVGDPVKVTVFHLDEKIFSFFSLFFFTKATKNVVVARDHGQKCKACIRIYFRAEL